MECLTCNIAISLTQSIFTVKYCYKLKLVLPQHFVTHCVSTASLLNFQQLILISNQCLTWQPVDLIGLPSAYQPSLGSPLQLNFMSLRQLRSVWRSEWPSIKGNYEYHYFTMNVVFSCFFNHLNLSRLDHMHQLCSN